MPPGGDPLAAQLIAAGKAGDWRTLTDLLAPIDHPDDHTFYLKIAADVGGAERWVDDWVAAEPRSPLPLLFKGAHAIFWAWEARGGGRANTVSENAFKLFFKRLTLAENCLDDVTDRDPDLPVVAHLEQWLDLGDEGPAYLRSAEVRASLHEAADRSVRHAEYVRRPRWPNYHNEFAMAFALSQDWAAAADQFDLIGDLVTEWPWQYLNGRQPDVPFLRWRTRTYQELGR
ncbi:hypothetical protein Pth03_33200 [Planotetraspora thailandica]|uniref:DUF4034 domain-containing protein n=1 Tax=Planotetraspora thailandica TaxID=487172 RepID=A0A8J3V4N4_9ACTN|nr:hypothetical protein [Planotetraspora thailandica]GII54931.1 hypothetical protein Pth03_33200 [Planotetraspora thailandica]